MYLYILYSSKINLTCFAVSEKDDGIRSCFRYEGKYLQKCD